ncbi:MAG: FeoB-associated Cys-rich membrane protein [Firmicutes bacterium]|nr:FeoB-associated Cys-rich membrane protein [Bacillota bacterium]
MGPLDILIVAVICFFVAWAVRTMIKRKKAGLGCGCCSMRKSGCCGKSGGCR